MRCLFILTSAALLAQSSAVSAQGYGNPVAMVDSWYRAYLGRTALRDPASAGWVNLLEQGHSPASVLSRILGSAEYFNRVGGTLPAYIQALYRQVVGRPPTPAEFNFWLRRAYSRSRRAIAYGILTQNAGAGMAVAPAAVVVPTWRPPLRGTTLTFVRATISIPIRCTPCWGFAHGDVDFLTSARDNRLWIAPEASAMLRRNLCLLLAASAILVAVLSVGVWLLRPRIVVTQASCDAIQPGMTFAEVTAIIGAPPGDYGSDERPRVVLDLYGGGVLMKEGELQQWGGDEGFIQVGFDANGTVLWKRFVEAGSPSPETPLDTLRRWLTPRRARRAPSTYETLQERAP